MFLKMLVFQDYLCVEYSELIVINVNSTKTELLLQYKTYYLGLINQMR